jgi:UDP-N-acetylmuramate dehydrogenase
VSQVITEVRAYDRVTGKICRFGRAECGFGYRTSMFKRDGARRYVVLSVTFGLAAQPSSAPVRYAELAAALGVQAGDQVPSAQARSAVLALRRGKGMVLDPSDPDSRSAGSFFVNPVLDPAALAVVEAAARDRCGPEVRVPRFDAGDGLVKVPAAWLIERAGFSRGYRLGGTDGGGTDGGGTDGGGGAPGGGALGARVSAKHTLALVNPGAATTAGLLDLARHIRDGVRDTFGVSLTPEPVLVGVTL